MTTDTDTVVVELEAVRRVGSIGVGSGHTEQRHPVEVAIDLRYAADLAEAIDRGERPNVVVESWAVITALPPRRRVS